MKGRNAVDGEESLATSPRRADSSRATTAPILRALLNPDSAVKPKTLEARCNPGAAKASDSEVSTSFWLSSSHCDKTQHPLAAPMIDVCSEAQTRRLRCGGSRLALSADRNCGIRVELKRI